VEEPGGYCALVPIIRPLSRNGYILFLDLGSHYKNIIKTFELKKCKDGNKIKKDKPVIKNKIK
jgi:hypothetical protein